MVYQVAMVVGHSHVAEVLTRTLRLKGWVVSRESNADNEIIFIAHDILDHSNLDVLDEYTRRAIESHRWDEPEARLPIVIVSQVPPGWTRKAQIDWPGGLFYQVDTLIIRRSMERALFPEQIIIGCQYPSDPLPLAYQSFLSCLNAPVKQVTYESAEVAKMAINYFLCSQVDTTNELVQVCEAVGASWSDVADVLRGDVRIGPKAYLTPGSYQNNFHLMRDRNTIKSILED